jgi:hypothetical protein
MSQVPSTRRRWYQFGLGNLLVVMTVLAGLSWVAASLSRSFRETPPPRASKAVRLRSEWPDRINQLVADAGHNNLDLSGSTVYQYITDEYFLESIGVPGLFDFLNDRWKLRQVRTDEWAAQKIRQRAPVGLLDESGWNYYVSDCWPVGKKGDSFTIAVDDRRDRIVVRYYYNF